MKPTGWKNIVSRKSKESSMNLHSKCAAKKRSIAKLSDFFFINTRRPTFPLMNCLKNHQLRLKTNSIWCFTISIKKQFYFLLSFPLCKFTNKSGNHKHACLIIWYTIRHTRWTSTSIQIHPEQKNNNKERKKQNLSILVAKRSISLSVIQSTTKITIFPLPSETLFALSQISMKKK